MFETTFDVLMYDTTYETAIQEGISAKLNQTISRTFIRLLPIESVRIEAGYKPADGSFQIYNQWIPYANKASRMTFRFICAERELCANLGQSIAENPKIFTKDLVSYYSLQTQRNAARDVK